nr:VP7 [Rotavirus I]
MLTTVSCTVIINEHVKANLCFLFDNTLSDADKNITNILTLMRDLTITTYSTCQYTPQSKQLVEEISRCACLHDPSIDTSVVFANQESNIATFIGNQNECTPLKQNSAIYVEFNSTGQNKEYFTFSDSTSVCYLSHELTGIGCDSTNINSWHRFNSGSVGKPEIVDLPEVGRGMAVSYAGVSGAAYTGGYLCTRTSNEPVNPVMYYTIVDQPIDRMSRAINWREIWKKVKSVALAIIQVVDILAKPRNVQPKV